MHCMVGCWCGRYDLLPLLACVDVLCAVAAAPFHLRSLLHMLTRMPRVCRRTHGTCSQRPFAPPWHVCSSPPNTSCARVVECQQLHGP
jgi:hypothetical protein